MSSLSMSDLALRIKTLRKELGLTQAQLSRHVGLSRLTIVNVEAARAGHASETSCRKVLKKLESLRRAAAQTAVVEHPGAKLEPRRGKNPTLASERASYSPLSLQNPDIVKLHPAV